ncbi:hypothetical protein SPHINGO8BC_20025 [Sphingobacterium multivorum]|uniref:Uncharacterized protein n=1 Tax=Sphingobacterium multivorum TaxID=28454 RepID=A0A654BBE2_SPHMU|nr:hypothetical protein SPHINGO8BC_20025 [Sphingobacterium multivorum]
MKSLPILRQTLKSTSSVEETIARILEVPDLGNFTLHSSLTQETHYLD